MRCALALAALAAAPACYQGSIEPEGDPAFEVDSKYGGFTIYRDGADLCALHWWTSA